MEKLLKLILIGLLGLLFSIPALAEDLFLDTEFKAYEEEFLNGSKACWSLKKNSERNACEKKLREKYAGDSRQRGSKAFVEKHYKPLSYEALQEQYLELKVLQKNAPTFAMWSDRPHGVLSQRIIGSELGLIEAIQGQRELAMYCNDNKKRIEGLGMSLKSLPGVCIQYFKEKEIEKKLLEKTLK